MNNAIPESWELPGLERLLEVVPQHNIPVETCSPGRSPHRPGDLLAGFPLDPMLAAAFKRLGKLTILSWMSVLTRCDNEVDCLVKDNTEWRDYWPHDFWPEHFRSLVLFGGEGLCCYATVPELADAQGLQPVVYVDPYEEIYALPVASSVDCFFDAFSRYLEIVVEDPEYQAGGSAWATFPWGVPEVIGRDRPLICMIKEGCFDQLMYERNKTGWRRESDIRITQE